MSLAQTIHHGPAIPQEPQRKQRPGTKAMMVNVNTISKHTSVHIYRGHTDSNM